MKTSLCFLILGCFQICLGAPAPHVNGGIALGGISSGVEGEVSGAVTKRRRSNPGDSDDDDSSPVPDGDDQESEDTRRRPGDVPDGSPGGLTGGLTGGLPKGSPKGLPIPGADSDDDDSSPVPDGDGQEPEETRRRSGDVPDGSPGGLTGGLTGGLPKGSPKGLPIPGAGLSPSIISPIVNTKIGSDIVRGKDNIVAQGTHTIKRASHLDLHGTAEGAIDTLDAAADTIEDVANDLVPGVGTVARKIYAVPSGIERAKNNAISSVVVPLSGGLLTGHAI